MKISLTANQVMGLTSNSALFNEISLIFSKETGPNHIDLINPKDEFRMTNFDLIKTEAEKKLEGKHKFNFNFMSLYKSNSFTYDDSYRPNPSAFVMESKIKAPLINSIKNELVLFADEFLIDGLAKEYREFAELKWGNWKGVFIANNLAAHLMKFGINDGEWSGSRKEDYLHFGKLFLDQNDWTIPAKQDWQPVPSNKDLQEYRKLGSDGWIELLKICPYLKMIDFTASSGFPHWRTQSMTHFYDYAGNAYEDAKSQYVMTLYARTQGGTLALDVYTDTFGNIRWKVRVVLGGAFPTKIVTYPVSYLYKLSEPDMTHYFKDGTEVMERELRMCLKADADDSLEVINTDLIEADTTQVKSGFGDLINHYSDMSSKYFPTQINAYTKVGMLPIKRPKVLINPRQMIQFKDDIAPSGHSLVPPVESASVFASHVTGILEQLDYKSQDFPDWRNDILDVLIQLDDVQLLSTEIDVEVLSKFMRKHHGHKLSAEKSNIFSEDKFITPLKVNVGLIYKKVIQLLDGSDCMEGSFLGFLMSKVYGMFDSERGARSDGQTFIVMHEDEIEWGKKNKIINQYNKIVIDGEYYFHVTKSVQSLFGSLSSFGPKCPISIYEMLFSYLGETITWKKMILVLRREFAIKFVSPDWGFGLNDNLIKLLLELAGAK